MPGKAQLELRCMFCSRTYSFIHHHVHIVLPSVSLFWFCDGKHRVFTELPDELIMGPGFGNMTLSNRHKITLFVIGKLESFIFHGVTQTQPSSGNHPELVWMKNWVICCSLHTFVCWWSRLHLKAGKLASSTDFKNRKLLPFVAVSKKWCICIHFSNAYYYRWSKTLSVVLRTLYLFIHPATVSQPCDVVIFRWTIINIVLRRSPTFLRESVCLLLSRFYPGDTECIMLTGSCL